MLERERRRVQLPCQELLGSDGNRHCQRDAGKAWYLQTFGVVSTLQHAAHDDGKEASVVQLHAAATPGQLEQERKNVNNALICLS
jgi:hypothetical protein